MNHAHENQNLELDEITVFRSNSGAMRFWNSFLANPLKWETNLINAGVLSQLASSNHALLITKSALVIEIKFPLS